MIRRRRAMLAAMGVEAGFVFVPTDIPQAEADALIAFYNATSGDSWTNNTNWLTDTTVANWFGVTVDGGHVEQIDLHSNNLAGAAGDTLAPLAGSLDELFCEDNGITSLGIGALTSLTRFKCGSNSIPALDASGVANGLQYISAADNGMSQAAVDSIIHSLWTRRADWTSANVALNVSGTNATPTGTYQDGYPTPLLALEEVHDLINDDDTAGIQTWAAISWNGGTAP